MKDVLKMFLTITLLFWLIVAHFVAVYFTEHDIKVSISLGLIVVHIDIFLISAFFTGYEKAHRVMEGEEWVEIQKT